MSDSYRNRAFALGLVVGSGIVLNLFLWLDYAARSEVEGQSSTGQGNQYSEVGRYWDGIFGTFVSPSDTLAQWIMAFFTIAATAVLILTLRSANKTNIAAVKASEAALEANQIMRDDQRPWLDFKALEPKVVVLKRGERSIFPGFEPKIEITNYGKSPAFGVNIGCMSFLGATFNGEQVNLLLDELTQIPSGISMLTVFPQEVEIIEKHILGVGSEFEIPVDGGKEFVWVVIIVSYVWGSRRVHTAKVFQTDSKSIAQAENSNINWMECTFQAQYE